MFLKAVNSLPSHLQRAKSQNKNPVFGISYKCHRVSWEYTFTSPWTYLLYSLSTKLRKISLLTVLKDSMTSKGSAWGNLSTHGRHWLKTDWTEIKCIGATELKYNKYKYTCDWACNNFWNSYQFSPMQYEDALPFRFSSVSSRTLLIASSLEI